jgi:hypothetical protein
MARLAHLLLEDELTASSGHVLPFLLPHRARQSVLLQLGLEHEGCARRRRCEVEIQGQRTGCKPFPELIRHSEVLIQEALRRWHQLPVLFGW